VLATALANEIKVLKFGHDKDKSRLPIMTLRLNPVEKPLKSKIRLTKNPTSLLIRIPPVGFKFSSFFYGGFVAYWNGFAILWTMIACGMSFPNNLALVAFSTPFWLVGGFLAYYYLYWFHATTYLKIENQTVEYVESIFGKRISGQKPITRSAILKLAFTLKYHSYDADGDQRDYPAQFQIDAGSQEIILGGFGSRIDNEAEVEWLAHEISEWLDIPLNVFDHSLPTSSDLYFPYALSQKPAQTKIKIIKRPDLLSICLPPYGYHSQILLNMLFCILLSGLVCFITWFTLSNLFFLKIAATFSFLFILCCLLDSLFVLFGKRYIQVDRQSINYIYMLFGIRINRHRIISRKSIEYLTFVRKGWWVDDGTNNHLPTLKIGKRPKQIEIGRGILKREDEINWLASEISEWLNIPIVMVDPVVIDQNLNINND
jgi:hypothetical protein